MITYSEPLSISTQGTFKITSDIYSKMSGSLGIEHFLSNPYATFKMAIKLAHIACKDCNWISVLERGSAENIFLMIDSYGYIVTSQRAKISKAAPSRHCH